MDRFKQTIKPWITIVIMLITWYFVSKLKLVSAYVLPSPQKVFLHFGI